VDRTALLNRLAVHDTTAFEQMYRASVDERVGLRTGREPRWTESIAVGRRDFVESAEAHLLADQTRTRTTRVESPDGTWILKEASPEEPYGAVFTPQEWLHTRRFSPFSDVTH
jgi:hypothetical protein